MASEVWSKTPPSEAGWYWYKVSPTHSPDVGWYEPCVKYGDSRVWGPRIPSPTALAAMEEAVGVARQVIRDEDAAIEELRSMMPEYEPSPESVATIRALRAALARLDAATGEARDWTEDATHENGNYQCRCSTCGETFMGHKRRVTCRVCAARSRAGSGAARLRDQIRAYDGPGAADMMLIVETLMQGRADLARLRAENERLQTLADEHDAAMDRKSDKIVTLRAELEEARAEVELVSERNVALQSRLDAALRALGKVRSVVPYVRATLPVTAEDGGEWGKAHLGRSASSIRQLEEIDKEAAAALAEGEQRAVHEYIERKATAQDALRALGKAAPVVEESLGVAHELSVEIRAALAEGE